MKSFNKSFRYLFATIIISHLLNACVKPDMNIRSELKVANLSPTAPALDYFVDSVKVNKLIGGYGFVTPYAYIESGLRNFRVKKSGREILYLSDIIETLP